VAVRAGIAAHVHPHLLRHAYGDHVAKHAGLRAAQALLGHASVDTTASAYVERPGLDELSISVHGFTYRATRGYPPPSTTQSRIRRRRESNRCKRLCRPPRSHSATSPPSRPGYWPLIP